MKAKHVASRKNALLNEAWNRKKSSFMNLPKELLAQILNRATPETLTLLRESARFFYHHKQVKDICMSKLIGDIGAAGNQTFVQIADKRLLAFGDNTFGQLGVSRHQTSMVKDIKPAQQETDNVIHRVSFGARHTFQIYNNDRLYGCGQNDYFQLGTQSGIYSNAEAVIPVPIENLEPGFPIKQLECGDSHSMLLFENGRLYGCGADYAEQLNLDHKPRSIWTRIPFEGHDEGITVDKIVLGKNHSFLFLNNGRITGFGMDGHDGFTSTYVAWIEDIRKKQPGNIAHFSCGNNHVLFVIENKLFIIHAYGRREMTLQVIHLDGIVVSQIASGDNHFFIVSANGDIYGWGCNKYNQLAIEVPSHIERLTKIPFPKPEKGVSIRKIAAGGNHSLIQLDNGDIYGCGDNGFGQLLKDKSVKTLKEFSYIANPFELMNLCVARKKLEPTRKVEEPEEKNNCLLM